MVQNHLDLWLTSRALATICWNLYGFQYIYLCSLHILESPCDQAWVSLLLVWEVDASQASGLQQESAEESLLREWVGGNADSILRRDDNTSSTDVGLWPDVGRDSFIKATSRQAVCLVQGRITALELGGASPPIAALQEADESHSQAIPCGKSFPALASPPPSSFISLQGASDCCKSSFLFGRTTGFFFPQLWKKWF